MDCSPPGSSVENNKSYNYSLKGHSPVWKEDSLTQIIEKGEKCFIRGELRVPKKHEDAGRDWGQEEKGTFLIPHNPP